MGTQTWEEPYPVRQSCTCLHVTVRQTTVPTYRTGSPEPYKGQKQEIK